MAETKLQNFTVQEKLNKMDVDLIDVTLTTANTAVSTDEVLTNGALTEIPNAVAVNGGTGLIQSIVLLDDSLQKPVIDLYFSQIDTTLGTLSEVFSLSDGDAASLLGYETISAYSEGSVMAFSVVYNIGMTIKAASGTKSIYVGAVNRSGKDITMAATDDIHLRIGVIKD